MMDKHAIIARLNEITSFFSFGRILGKISLNEIVGIERQLKHGQEANRKRLISTEIDFLCGLWLQNINLSKHWDFIQDQKIMDEVYDLMDDFHISYKKSHKQENLFAENFFYEGDLAYDWQYIKFGKEKYEEPTLSSILLDKFEFEPSAIESTYNKVRKVIETQLQKRIEEKQRKNEYISYVNLFTIKHNKISKLFTEKEQKILKRFTHKLGNRPTNRINDIIDYNRFKEYPLIELPNNRGLFVANLHSLAAALNETPYYWLLEDEKFQKRLADIRGNIAEKIVHKIIQRRFPNSSYHHILIKRTKSSDIITDIDVLLCSKTRGIVFQVKSKRLTELSKRGDFSSIEKDYKMAVTEAYNQGVKCIECLKHASEYYSLKKAKLDFTESLQMVPICVTLDSFPGISSLNFINQPKEYSLPLIAMTIYDLDTIFYLFQPETIIDYFIYRAQCAKHNVYGVNEMYYIGAYIAQYHDEGIKLLGNKICREYALYADYVVKKAMTGSYRKTDIDCDIYTLVNKYLPQNPITCE